ncbi:MAG: TetR/AcrR family transcriptional regulator [Marmoricola sp.]
MSSVVHADIDGRRARRHRNTDAVLDAVHALFVEGLLEPTVEDIAARSGVSLRSVYRYFPDRDQLLQAALARRLQVAEPLFHIVGLGEGSLEERIQRFADHRIELYERIAPTARAALSTSTPLIADVVRRRRRQLAEQTSTHFAPELDVLSDDEASDVLAAVETLCQFESLEALRVQRTLSPERTRAVLVRALRALLVAPPD